MEFAPIMTSQNTPSSASENADNNKESSKESTREKLLTLASELMREKGYAGFSYADLAQAIGIKKASIHHHFPSKADLGVAVVADSYAKVQGAFAQIAANYDSLAERLTAYVALFAESLDRLPMCASLVADKHHLPAELLAKTPDNFTLQLGWLERILTHAIATGEIGERDVPDTALMILNLCEGAGLVANALGDKGVFERTLEFVLRLASWNSSICP